jgi:hypothetical protein
MHGHDIEDVELLREMEGQDKEEPARIQFDSSTTFHLNIKK